MKLDPDPIVVEAWEIEDGDILKDHLGQRVKFPMRCDGELWFLFDAHRPYPKLITVLPLDAEVEVLRAPKDVSEESAYGNDAVSVNAADPPSSGTTNSSTGGLPGCRATMSSGGEGVSVRPASPTAAIPATDDDPIATRGMTWEQRRDRPSWHPDDCQLDCCWTREPIDQPPGRQHDDDVFVERVGWVSAQFAAELPMVRANLARLDDGPRISDDTPPRGITRPFYVVQ